MKKSWIIRAAVVTAALVSTALAGPTSPAQAGECTTQGCGGEVLNRTSRVVYVTNCWLSGNPGIWYGSIPSCATNGYNLNKFKAYYGLGPNQNTRNFSKYYDTDAIRVDNGCTLTFSEGGLNHTHSARGIGSHLWVKINNHVKATVTNYSC
ncbi:hypothetical protein [Actinoplanes sp. DH11]|uniref:hypothetical protein n=1 Tax=Actinoplanes sp. DH11 TaxID=2857011 RepID=UPI001E4268FC|nr:hypothetical protein [Actinoplanes sp. DH11]